MAKEEVSNKIIQAATHEFTAKGLDAASMENIAKIANVSKRTLYKYFPTKESVFDHMVSELVELACGYPKIDYSPRVTLETQLKQILDKKVELLTSSEYVATSRLVLSEIIKGKPLQKDQLDKFYEAEKRFLKWIEAAKKDGKIKSTLSNDLIANQIHSILKGQLFYPVIFGFKEVTAADIKIAKKTTLDFFLNSFCK